MNVLSLLSSEIVCSRLLRTVRWSNGVYCARCDSRSIKGHVRCRHGLKRCFCKFCKKTFNDMIGTIMHYPRITIGEDVSLLYLTIILGLRLNTISRSTNKHYKTILGIYRKPSLRVKVLRRLSRYS